MRVFIRLVPTLVLALAGCEAPSSEGLQDDFELAQAADESEETDLAADDAPTRDVDSLVVASFDAHDGRKIEFLESEPGVIIIMQTRDIGTAPLASPEEAHTLKPEELYERLAGKKAPRELLAASRRSEAHQSELGPTTPAARAGDNAEESIGVSSSKVGAHRKERKLAQRCDRHMS